MVSKHYTSLFREDYAICRREPRASTFVIPSPHILYHCSKWERPYGKGRFLECNVGLKLATRVSLSYYIITSRNNIPERESKLNSCYCEILSNSNFFHLANGISKFDLNSKIFQLVTFDHTFCLLHIAPHGGVTPTNKNGQMCHCL